MSRRRSITALGLSLALLATACGGGDENADGGSGGSGSAGGGGGGEGVELPDCPVDALASASGPIELTVWHSQTAKPEEALQQLVGTYNDSQDKVEVSLESQGASYEELVDKYLAAIPSGDLPDLVLVDDTSTQLLADSGTVLPAQACIDADNYDLSGFDPTAIAYYTIDGALYPGSVGLANIILYYNKNHFRAAGLDPDDPPETLAEVREYAEKIADAGITETPVVHELASWKTEFWLTGAGAPIVDNDNGRGGEETTGAAFDSEAARQLYQWFADMDADGLLLPVARTDGSIEHYLALASQSASMTVESTSAATSVEAFLQGDLTDDELGADTSEVDLTKLDIGAGPFPGLDAPGKMQVGGFAWYLTTAGSDEEQSASWDFVKFLNTPDSQVTLTLVASALPWLTAAADDPRIVEAWDSSLSGKWMALAYDQQMNGLDPAFPGPLIGPYGETRTAIEDSMDALLLEDTSVDDAVAQAQADIDAAVQVYRDEGF
jgi:sn-glycerol 3-phosphate transport system substrate-binding protein